jgi:hypothetical protein
VPAQAPSDGCEFGSQRQLKTGGQSANFVRAPLSKILLIELCHRFDDRAFVRRTDDFADPRSVQRRAARDQQCLDDGQVIAVLFRLGQFGGQGLLRIEGDRLDVTIAVAVLRRQAAIHYSTTGCS